MNTKQAKRLTYAVIVIISTLILLSFGGCKPCEPIIQNHYSVEYDTLTVTRDTIVYVQLPGQVLTEYIEVEVPAHCPQLNVAPIELEGNLAIARAWMYNSKLNLSLKEKDTLIEVKLSDALREVQYWKSEYEKATEVYEIPADPRVAWYIWIFAGVLIGFGLVIMLRR